MRKYILLNIIIFLSFHTQIYSADQRQDIDEVLGVYFSDCKEAIHVQPLFGGCEAVSYTLYKDAQRYVLRFFNDQPLQMNQRELYAMQEAAKIGISPRLYYITSDVKAVLMEFIEGETASIASAKLPENSIKIAQALRKIHAIAKNPYPREDFLTWNEDFYHRIVTMGKNNDDVENAIQFIRENVNEIEKSTINKVNTHGDLNPRNIFFGEKKVQLIDWTYSRWEDPFNDLAIFSLYHCYDAHEELFLLEAYLEHVPTVEEIQRFNMNKKLSLANLFLNMYSYAFDKVKTDPSLQIDTSVQPHSWQHYAKIFAQRVEQLTPQFFYEWARSAFNEL